MRRPRVLMLIPITSRFTIPMESDVVCYYAPWERPWIMKEKSLKVSVHAGRLRWAGVSASDLPQ